MALALCCAAAAASAACRVTEIDDAKPHAVIMENDAVAVKLLPEVHGIVDDIRLKSKGLPTLFHYRETRRELLPASGIYYQKKNLVNGNCNALWPAGWSTFRGAHRHRVVENGPDRVAVEMTQEAKGWRIERQVSLAKEMAAIDLTVRITNTSDAMQRKAYWNISVLRLADTLLSMPGDDSEMLLMPARKESRSIQDRTAPVPKSHVSYRSPERGKNVFLPPSQPWMAAVDKTHKLIFAGLVDLKGFPAELVFYSNASGRDFYTMEFIFPPAEYAPGQTRELRQRLMVLSGLTDVDLVRPGYALKVVRLNQTLAKERLSVKLAILGSRRNSPVSFSLVLRAGARAAASAAVRADAAGPVQPVYVDVSLPTAGLAGKYVLTIQEPSGSLHEVLGRKVTIQ